MLIIEGLQVELGGKELLKHINLEIRPGETHILFGPNGSGKTSLLMTLMGYPQYKVRKGKITFNGVDITHKSIDERARLGIGMAYQRPPTVNGLKLRHMIEICAGEDTGIPVEQLAERVNFRDFLDRDINAGFSGGEIKRSELLQLMAQNPELLLFDEPESGVDIENIALVGGAIAALLQKDRVSSDTRSTAAVMRERTKMGLIITHTGYILDYVPADKGQVLFEGVLACAANPREILSCITQSGYEECVKCAIESS